MQIHTLDHLWVPSVEKSSKLILVLHGRGDSLHGFTWLPNHIGNSDCNYLLVNAPDDWYGGFSWYDMAPDQWPGIERSMGLLNQLFAELQAEGYASENILLFGFSQGCLMSMEWGGRYSKPLMGLVGVSGFCYDVEGLIKAKSSASSTYPWLVTHGRQDEVLPFERSQSQSSQLKAGGLDIEFHAFDKSHTIEPKEELPLIVSWIRRRLEE